MSLDEELARVKNCLHPIVQSPIASLGHTLVELTSGQVPILRCCGACQVEWTLLDFPLELMPDLDRFCGGIAGLLGTIISGTNIILERWGDVPMAPVLLDFSAVDRHRVFHADVQLPDGACSVCLNPNDGHECP